MLRNSFIALSLAGALSAPAMACTETGTKGIVEDNDLYISADAKSLANANLDEEAFNQIIDKVSAIYAPIITEKGGTLDVKRNWNDGTVNAFARRVGSTWEVSMFGGLARHEAITKDGFALVVCHEIGHHIGGAPKKRSGWFGSTRWASNEGQADYFATLKCLRRVFAQDDNKALLANVDVPAAVIDSCLQTFTTEDERLICQRGAMAGMSTASLFQALRNQTTAPDFTTPDSKVVTKTNHNHPDTQCRLDTYFAGAICEMNINDEVSQRDETKGVCYRNNGQTTGVRPFCWFKPKN